MKPVISPETVARECQEIARRYVEAHGRKLGLHLFGRAIGEGDRRARAICCGEARRIEAHEYLLARQADVALIRAQIEHSEERMRRLRRELEGFQQNGVNLLGDCVGISATCAGD